MKQKLILLYIFLWFLIPGLSYSKTATSSLPFPQESNPGVSQNQAYKVQQIASFKNKKNAEDLVTKLKKEGKDAAISKHITNEKGTLYRVFVKESKDMPVHILSAAAAEPEQTAVKTVLQKNDTRTVVSAANRTEPVKNIPSAGATQQIASFKIFNTIEEAENYAKQLRQEGYIVKIRSVSEKDDKTVFTVFASTSAQDATTALPADTMKQDAVASVQERSSIKDPRQTLVQDSPVKERTVKPVASASGTATPLENKPLAAKQLTVPAAGISTAAASPGTVQQGSAIPQPQPSASDGATQERPSAEVFGRQNRSIHPFLSITELYTDNAHNSRSDKKSDFVTILSPGIWLSVPIELEQITTIDTSTLSPSGLNLSRYPSDAFKRYQAYLSYVADIEFHSRDSSEQNTVSHKAEGLLQYNFRGGLSLELIDQFLYGHDDYGTGISTDELDEYYANALNFIATYRLSERFKLRGDYTYYIVRYDGNNNEFRDRDDNAFSGYIFYKFKPKTSFFLQYQFIDIQYDEDTVSNSREHHYLGGIQWDITAKTTGSVKAGYGFKDFTDSDVEDSKDFIMELQLNHRFTPKTSVYFTASRNTNETNISTTDYILSTEVALGYIQILTSKLTADVRLAYTNDIYREDLTYDDKTDQLNDKYYTGSFSLRHKVKRWLDASIGYLFEKRDSNFSEFDYTTNSVFFRLTGSL